MEIEQLGISLKCDVLCLTETWTKDYQVIGMNIENYELATYFHRTFFEHGGTAIFVKDDTEYRIRKDLNQLSFEMNCELCAIEMRASKIVIICIYRPNKDLYLFFDILTKILHKLTREGKKIVLAGDFNLNLLQIDSKIRKLIDILDNFNCKHIIDKPTRTQGASSSCIDNFITNFDTCKGKVLNTKLSDHNVILLDIKTNELCKTNTTPSYIRKMSLNNCNYFHFLVSKDHKKITDEIGCAVDANEKMSILMRTIVHFYNIAFPKRRTIRKETCKKIYTKGIDVSRNNLIKLEMLQNVQPTQERLVKIRKYKKTLRKVLKGAKKLHYAHRIKVSNNKIKEAWNIINEQIKKKVNCKSNIKYMNDGIEKIDDPKKIGDLFNKFFLNVAHNLTKNSIIDKDKCKTYLSKTTKPSVSIKFNMISKDDLFNLIKNMKCKTSMDIYDMNTKTLKELVLHNYMLFDLIYEVINSCFDEGIFPDSLKSGRIIPIYKKGEHTELSNYRPICVLPTLSKILETILKHQIIAYFEENNLFTPQQFGFRKNRSTEMAIREVVQYLLQSLDESQKCASIYCDLSKAFDCLRHDILILKLTYYGFKAKELDMMISYLRNRTQTVSVKGQTSFTGNIDIGVPQGSVLGPLLFLIYVNDIVNAIPDWATISLFADDTHVGIRDKNNDIMNNKISLAMSTLHDWFKVNGIILNADKSLVMKYQVKKEKDHLIPVQENVFLGYTIDYTLTHSPHIDKLCKKIASANYALLKLKPLIDLKTLLSVYYAYVHSVLSYAITTWGNGADIKRVLICQKRSIRIINGIRRRESAKKYFVKNQIMTVISLYIYKCILEVYNNIDKYTKKSDIHKYNTRNKDKLYLPKVRLTKVKKQGEYNKLNIFNKLPTSLTKLPMPDFKIKIKLFFTNNAFYTLNEFMTMKLNENSFNIRNET